MSLYFILITVSAGIPVLMSFDKRLRFYKKWKFVFPAITIVAMGYLIFDVIFTEEGVWGFNPDYLSGIFLMGLPLEEILFFFAIPYASIFLHYSFVECFPTIKPNEKLTRALTYILMAISFFLVVFNTGKIYTSYIFSKLFLVLLLSFLINKEVIQQFYITFLIILIPFTLVNGILTGNGINGEIVWYNNFENLGIRFFTIPVEDFGYAFSLVLFNLILIELLKKIYSKT